MAEITRRDALAIGAAALVAAGAGEAEAASRPTIYGYLRLSDHGKTHLEEYIAQLKSFGATEIVMDEPTPYYRPNMDHLLATAQKGDAIVVMRKTHLAGDPFVVGQLEEAFVQKGIALAVIDPSPVVYKVEGAGGDHGGNGHG